MNLSAERLREILHYDPETGVWTWRMRASRFSRVRIGALAGCLNGGGYWQIAVDGCVYLAHRLAWLYTKGEWPASDLDHEDLDRSANRWDNLRLATKSQNAANTRARSNNKSGLKGASRYNRNGKWQSGIVVGGKRIFLGLFDTAEEAHVAYVAAAEKFSGEFARAS
jgi:hypothetical protein